tara:strand:- start:25350 stop:25562 length:213 start_codon:yes stop_codon:yes gene_type:complete
MNTTEIYKLASELTEKEVNNVIAKWEGESLKSYNSLIKLGDSMQLACATVIAEIYNDKGESKMYQTAYHS